MTDDISRRDLVKGAAIGAAAVAVPLDAALALVDTVAPAAPPAPKPDKMAIAFAEVQKLLAEQKREDIDAAMQAPYYRIFRIRASGRNETRLFEAGLGYAIPRKAVMDGNALQSAKETLPGLWLAFRELRDTEAADIFNNPHTKGADRPQLLSVAKGNTFEVPRDLSRTSLQEAIDRITVMGTVPYALIVPKALSAEGERLTKQELGGFEEPLVKNLIVWDALTNPQAWFVLTQTDGLAWIEREGFEMDAWQDRITDNILIKAYERRGFTVENQQAIFGSAPAAPYCTQFEKLLDRYHMRSPGPRVTPFLGLAELKETGGAGYVTGATDLRNAGSIVREG